LIISYIKEEEIKEATNQCRSTNSHGHDGFNFHFIKNSWDIVKYDIIQAMNYFQQIGTKSRGCNAYL